MSGRYCWAMAGIRDFLQTEGRLAWLLDQAVDHIGATEADIEMER